MSVAAILAGIRMLFASPLARKVMLALAVVAVVLGGAGYVSHLRTAAAEAADAKAHADQARNLAESELTMVRANYAANEALVAAELERAKALAPKVASLQKEIARARKPLPALCDPALDPMRDAVAGVRSLRAGKGGASGTSSGVPPVR